MLILFAAMKTQISPFDLVGKMRNIVTFHRDVEVFSEPLDHFIDIGTPTQAQSGYTLLMGGLVGGMDCVCGSS